MRTFIAIAIPTHIQANIKTQQQILARDLDEPPVRWVKAESIHLTLKFLGEISPEQSLQIPALMPDITGQFPSTRVVVEGVGCFPNHSRPRVIWIGIKEEEAVVGQLQSQLDRKLEDLGFSREARGFSPHLTIGRVHRQVGNRQRRELGEKLTQVDVPALGGFVVDMIHLYRSDLKPSGAVYTCLASASLRAGHE